MTRRFLTASNVQSDFCTLVENIRFLFNGEDTTLLSIVSGNLYQAGYRPRDSRKEDIVVIHTAGIADKDLVRGEVTINIFSQDVQAKDVMVADPIRVPLLESALQAWVEALTTEQTNGYKISSLEPIVSVEDSIAKEHFAVAHLQYEYCLTN